jgi:hypothetical protein
LAKDHSNLPTGQTFNARYTNASGQVGDSTANAGAGGYVDWDGSSSANYLFAVTEKGSSGYYEIETPAFVVAAGPYGVAFLDSAGVARAQGGVTVLTNAAGKAAATLDLANDTTGAFSAEALANSPTATVTYSQAAAAAGQTSLSAGTIAMTRGTSISIAITGLGSLAGVTKLWFTAKTPAAVQSGAPDSASALQLELSAGLLYVNGSAAASSADGAVTITDGDTGAIRIDLDADAAKLLAAGTYLFDVKTDAAGTIKEPTYGTLIIRADVTRAVG